MNMMETRNNGHIPQPMATPLPPVQMFDTIAAAGTEIVW